MGEGEGKKGETRETRGQSVTVHLFLCNTHQEAGVQEWCRVRRFALFADNGFFCYLSPRRKARAHPHERVVVLMKPGAAWRASKTAKNRTLGLAMAMAASAVVVAVVGRSLR